MLARFIPLAVLALSGFVAADDGPARLLSLRIEGATNTIFEGLVLSRGRNVTTPSGGTHPCDGLNNGANPKPGPTCTTALADAARVAHFPFDGTFDPEFDDFFITSIGDSTQTATQFWGLLLDFQFTPVGGCQQEVKNDQQDILWAFDAFNKVHFLKLDGPNEVREGKTVTYTITDGSTGQPVAGATLHGQVSDANGQVSFKFKEPGVHTLKAEKSDSIRSNALPVLVV